MNNHLFPELARVVQDGISRGLHFGVQCCVSLRGETVLNTGFGTVSDGVPLTNLVPMLWRSAGKPLTALLIMKRIVQKRLDLGTCLHEIIPESGLTDKAEVTVFQLLTHTAGFPDIETGWPDSSWSESIRNVLFTPCTLPLGTAAYHPQSSWFLLGEILVRTSDGFSSFEEVLRNELLIPLGMVNSGAGGADVLANTTATVDSSNEGRSELTSLPPLYERNAGQLVVSPASHPPFTVTVSPGGTLRGPVSELAKVYELLMKRGRTIDHNVFLPESAVQMMCSRQRAGHFDQTLQHVVDFGLGVIVCSSRYGADTVPYGFGRYASENAYGHGGSQCSMGFCDPEHQLVVAWAANGLCGEGQHQRRNRAINEAIYRDLQIA